MPHLENLNEQQKKAVVKTNGPLLIIAGAGAGKTKTITHRIAHIIANGTSGARILALTFTNKAASEMRERVKKLLVHASAFDVPSGSEHARGSLPLLTTFHALGARLLREFYQEAGVARGFVIWDRDDSIRAIKRIIEELDFGKVNPRTFLSAISRQKSNGVDLKTFEKENSSWRDEDVAKVWQLYERALQEEDALDFDDLLLRVYTLLSENTSVQAKLQSRWTHITIDEYQDTNRVQFEIARLLIGPAHNICVVGDIDQNIYSWRGANIEHLLNFEEVFPGTTTVLLEQNYRSTRTILAAANAVIVKNVRRKEKNLFTENETGEPIMLYGARNELDEAWYVAQQIQKMLASGTKASEVAVLYRENFQSRALEEALLRMSIPYRVLGVRFFERAEVKDVLSYLRAARNPKSKSDLSRIVAVPPRGIGKTTLEKMLTGATLTGTIGVKVQKFWEQLTKIRHALETLPASEAVRYAAEESGIEDMLKNDKEEGQERLSNIFELVNLAVRYDDTLPPEGIERLLEEAALQSEQDSLEERGGKVDRNQVSLMTVHASKGLEFDAVFVTGLEQGLFPSMREDTKDSEEERRLFYVAITRARKQLLLSYAQERMKYGSREAALPSQFLDDIDERLLSSAKPKRGLLDDWSDVIH